MALSKPEMGLLKHGMDPFRPGMVLSGPGMGPFRTGTGPFRPGTGPLRLTLFFDNLGTFEKMVEQIRLVFDFGWGVP